ncbi:DUF6516 family protein [Gracilibacillus salinarum]|uniref:DUF6516 family protein n=1 Tax=Gracilibacillus salinarum TaxID=2932255 RepID=A0ABY4GR57_9BACI|nr:DUF6516 family protein [Gracilibacillus salinarum]UOQ86845.1 DUF6516 family protein [Gracilibacillus salinarum]
MKNRTYADIHKPLFPADLPILIEKFEDIFETYSYVPVKEKVYPKMKLTTNLLSVLFPFIEHPVYGKTGLHAIEKYKDGIVKKYMYQWKIIIPKKGKHKQHITAWGNDPHAEKNTPPELHFKSEPHHHHYIPGDWNKRKDNWEVWSLDDALHFVAYYIRSGKEYKPK